MRRRVLVLAAAGVAVVLAGTGIAVWLVGTSGFLDTDSITADPVAILPMHDADLGISAPPGLRTVAARKGGFQDRFVQIRLSASQDGFDALLRALDLTRGDLGAETAPYLGPAGPDAPDWWPEASGPFLTTGLPSPRLDHLTLAARPDPGDPDRWQILLWGFNT